MPNNNKGKGVAADTGDSNGTVALASGSASASTAPKSSRAAKGPDYTAAIISRPGGVSPASPPLLISRNKHWRFISCYHGYWLSMSVETMRKMAHINYNATRPPPIHPGTFFDLAKIRSSVSQAVMLGVKAVAETKSRKVQSVHRKRACNHLARAYRLDEVATSVAVMQETSSLEDAGSHVLENKKEKAEGSDLIDAKYVHFFEEKIPSRQVAEFTNFEALDYIIDSSIMTRDPILLPGTYRTRAFVKAFKNDHEGAASDLKQALSYLHEGDARSHNEQAPETPGPEAEDPSRRRKEDVELIEEDQPTGLQTHLLFQRASMFLSISCKYLQLSMPSKKPQNGKVKDMGSFTEDAPEVDPPAIAGGGSDSEDDQTAKARIQVKKFARLARLDFMAFLSLLEYTPDLPANSPLDFTRRIRAAHQHNSVRQTRTPDSGVQYSNKLYKMSDLFKEVLPSDLPEWPSAALVSGEYAPSYGDKDTFEAVTFHPLLGEALHCLLLCHCLMQTPAKELARYAYMASRLYVLANPWPLFQPSRSPARGDWMEILDKCAGKIQLALPWEKIAPYPPPQPFAKESNFGVGPNQLQRATRPVTPPNLIERTEIDAMKERLDGDEPPPRTGKELVPASSAVVPATNSGFTPIQHRGGQQSLSMAALEEKEQRRIAGRGEYIARWVNEVPFVKMPGRRRGRDKDEQGR